MSEAGTGQPTTQRPTVVVTGANGLVGHHVVEALVERGAAVRAVVRREGGAPQGPYVEERVGDFTDAGFAAEVVAGADALVTTVHPMGDDLEAQRRVGVEGTTALARAAADAGLAWVVHVSTAAVYDRSPGQGDVDETAPLVPDDAGDYPVTKRDLDLALAEVEGPTRVLLRPPAILGPGESSVWNSLRPAGFRDDPDQRRADPTKSFAWVHVRDLAALAADVATGRVPTSDDPDAGPVPGGCTPVNVSGEPASWRDYLGAVGRGTGVDPEWVEQPVWTGDVLADRARGWGWTPQVSLAEGLDELEAGLR
ncbi:NAD-dependent epimerase/dehydratase family protein [Nocardioides litoris]|uniref:NAD-dependent epimerase/dehydratase family protein n=1 Tax=Nocardioides litoris TaxID=1926648 RepID=UPI00111E646C|nr:NAD-dependent epimerase/dehydratase family protein [Nocardioides litoris]